MSNLSTHLQRQTATLRQLKLLVLVLIVSNITLGAFCFYFVRTIDTRYTDLIDVSVPQLNELQTLTVAGVEAMRAAGTSLAEAPPEQRQEAIQKARAAFGRDRVLRNRTLEGEWLAAGTKERTELQDAGDAFSQSGGEVVTLFAEGKITESTRLRAELLRPAFDKYIAATARASELLHQESLRASGQVKQKAVSILALTAGLAGWPVIFAGALLVFATVLIVAFSVLFRARDLSGAP